MKQFNLIQEVQYKTITKALIHDLKSNNKDSDKKKSKLLTIGKASKLYTKQLKKDTKQTGKDIIDMVKENPVSGSAAIALAVLGTPTPAPTSLPLIAMLAKHKMKKKSAKNPLKK